MGEIGDNILEAWEGPHWHDLPGKFPVPGEFPRLTLPGKVPSSFPEN